MPPLVLASGSPRRRELLSLLDLPFEVAASEVSEESALTEPGALAQMLARRKALAVAELRPEAIILAADTVVASQGQLLAKPRDAAQNRLFLQLLSGQTHHVYTGVTAWREGHLQEGIGETAVTFRPLTEAEMDFYVASGEGLDKAGGYSIQGLGAVLVSSIIGEYSNVVGLPLSLTAALLRAQGQAVWGSL